MVFASDCAACRGRCCVIPPFDAVQGFAFDKPAHTACPNLQEDFRCGVHGELVACGFAGCAAYDCHGAGQSLTRWLDARGWGRLEGQEARAGVVSEQFGRLDRLHRLGALLTTALGLPTLLDHPRRATLEDGFRRVSDACRRSLSDEPPSMAEVAALQSGVMLSLQALRSSVKPGSVRRASDD